MLAVWVRDIEVSLWSYPFIGQPMLGRHYISPGDIVEYMKVKKKYVSTQGVYIPLGGI